MEPQDEVASLFKKIIDEAIDKNIFKLKFKSLADSLSSSYYNFKNNFNPESNSDLHKIIDILNKLSAQINIINNPSLFSYFLEKKQTIEELVSDINLSIDNLNAELSEIGVEERHKFLTDDSYQDYIEVYDLLDQNINILNQRKKEVKEILSRCSNNFQYKSPKQIVEQYGKSRLPKENYTLGDLIRNPKFYSLYTKRNDPRTFLLEIKDNKKYLQRALSIYSSLKNESVEKFNGFYIDNEEEFNNDDSDPKVIIVTERKGKSLHELLQNNTLLKSGDKTIILYKIAKAMSEIHLKCIFHRNLSTNNVNAIITNNEEIKIMITNFIYSRVMDEEINPVYTKSLALDPARFTAPEFEGSTQYDHKIDVFSFAAIAYELATGKVPFDEFNDDTVKKMLANEERPPLDKINKDLADLIEKCWKQNPSERYSFSQVMNEMVGKRIIVEQENEDVLKKTNAFYDKFPNNYYSIIGTSLTFEKIKNDMKKSVQYKRILYSTRDILNQCSNFLDTEYKSNDTKSKEENKKPDENKPNDTESKEENKKLDENKSNDTESKEENNKLDENKPNDTESIEENDKLDENKQNVSESKEENDNLNENKPNEPNDKIKQLDASLDIFSSTIKKTTADSWDDLQTSFEEITEEIVKNMNCIIESMNNLGFKLDKYTIPAEDLVSDARQLYFAYKKKIQENKKVGQDSAWSQKSEDLKAYIKKNYKSYYRETFTSDLRNLVSEINKLLTNFSSRKLQYDAKNFEEYKVNAIEDQENYDDLDEVTDHKLYKGKSSIHRAFYRSSENSDLKSVAIKKFKYIDLMSHNSKSYLRNEIEFLSNVNHEYIANFIGYMNVEPLQEFWIITELANNKIMPPTLKKMIPTLNSKQKTQFALKLATVMKYLHSININHRGLTSENILISGDCPKLIDFVNASPYIRGIDHGQILTDAEYDTKNDTFAFSMILYEMLTGKVLKGPNYQIDENVRESNMKELIKEFLASSQNNELNFEQIYNMMTNRDISFPE